MYLMPTYSKKSSAHCSAGFRLNAAYHVAKDDTGELRTLCGSENVEGPAEAIPDELPVGVCGSCVRLMRRIDSGKASP